MRLDFEKNLGLADRVLRAIIGTFLAMLVLGNRVKGWKAVLTKVFTVFMYFEAAAAY